MSGYKIVGICLRAVAILLSLASLANSAGRLSLSIGRSEACPEVSVATMRPGQLPLSTVATGAGRIAAAWFAGATDRYNHGVLGDLLEASRLVVETREGVTLEVALTPERVFEDLEPRLADLDGDGLEEILVVESDLRLGASLAVYALEGERLVKRGATPFLGRPYRWLNPVGVGDFDGDGKPELALVATPHIGGILRLYRYTPPELKLFAEYAGVSTHRSGSTELGLGRLVVIGSRDLVLLPDQKHEALLLLEWDEGKITEAARLKLPVALDTNLVPCGPLRWRFTHGSSETYEVKVVETPY